MKNKIFLQITSATELKVTLLFKLIHDEGPKSGFHDIEFFLFEGKPVIHQIQKVPSLNDLLEDGEFKNIIFKGLRYIPSDRSCLNKELLDDIIKTFNLELILPEEEFYKELKKQEELYLDS